MKCRELVSSACPCSTMSESSIIASKKIHPNELASAMVKINSPKLLQIPMVVTASKHRVMAQAMEVPSLLQRLLPRQVHQVRQVRAARVARRQIIVHNTLNTTVVKIRMLHMVAIKVM